MNKMATKFWIFAMALSMAFFAACTSDGSMQVIMSNGDIYSEDEYNELVKKGEIDEDGNYVVKDSAAKSSSSVKSSSSEKASSSAAKSSSS